MDTKRQTVPAAEEILNRYIPVLDHGFVALKDYMGGDDAVEEAARVSYQSGTRTTSDQRTLIRYLRRHRHTSPSEQVEVKLHVGMPIFVARQLVRHRTFSINEISGRYSLMPLLFYTPQPDQMRPQSSTNKQGRSGAPVSLDRYERAVEDWRDLRARAVATYEGLTAGDVAREIARIDLPLSTYTSWVWKADLHNLFHMVGLRADPHAQWETRVFANVIAGVIQRIAPLSFEAWIDYEFCGVRFSRMERIAMLRMIAGHFRRPEDACHALGMSGREVEEFGAKMAADPRDKPSFSLDLSSAKDPEHFERMYRESCSKPA